jgi:hypothetical protein
MKKLLAIGLILSFATSAAFAVTEEEAREARRARAETVNSSAMGFLTSESRVGKNCKAATKAAGAVLLNISNGYGINASLVFSLQSQELIPNVYTVTLNEDLKDLPKAVYEMTVEKTDTACVIKSVVQK